MSHLWAERLDRDIGDLFALQDEITSRIANALNIELIAAEAARPSEHADAFDYILRGRAARLSAGVCVLLGIGFGFGGHYFVDRTGGRAAASATTSPAKQDAPNPPSSNPTAQREGPVPDVPRGSGSSDAQQPARSMALDLSNEEKLALITLLTRNIADDRRQSSARVRSLKQILLKLDPKPPAQPSSPPKVSAPPDAKRGSVRRRE